MNGKAKISDVRQGVTLYKVSAFPYRGASKSSIEPLFVTKPPVFNTSTRSLFSEARHFFDDEYSEGSYVSIFSLRDAGIVPNIYNFHKTFTSLKSAKSYAARMDRRCLTAAERVKCARIESRETIRLYGV